VTDTSNADAAVPFGTVYFFDGATLIGSAPLDNTGNGTLTTALLSLSASPHAITANFAGNSDFSASTTSSVVLQTVNPRPSTTTASVNPSTVVVGQSSTVTATVSDAATTGPAGPFGTFAAKGNLNTGRTGHAAAFLPNGTVLVAGGQDSSGNVLSSAETYDSTSGTFTANANGLRTRRTGATATLLNTGKVLITGGTSTGMVPDALSSAELFDPLTGMFTALTGAGQSLTTPRFNHTATLLPSGKVLIAGGTDSNGNPLKSTELFDSSTNTFGAGPGDLDTPRSGHSATLLPTGKILIAGGSGLNTAVLYDPTTSNSTPTGSMTTDRTNHAAVLQVDANVLVMGGTTSGATATAEVYDTGTGAFTALDSTHNMTTPRAGLSATMLDTAQVVVIGGSTDGTPAGAQASTETVRPSFDTLGTVTVTSNDGTDAIASSPCTLLPSGTGSTMCQTQPTNTPANVGSGTHTLSAAYTPAADQVHTSSNNAGQSDGKNQLTVNPAPTSTTVSSSADPSIFGQSVTFTATVANAAGGGVSSATPTGSVQFYIDGTAFGSPVTLAGSGASATATSAITGSLMVSGSPHSITAAYKNTDGNFVNSDNSNSPLQQSVKPAPTATMVASSLNPSVFGQSVTFTATVMNNAGTAISTATPTGSVQFCIDDVPFGLPVTLTASGTATSNPIASLTVSGSPHTITAKFVNADGNFFNSNGSLGGGQTVNRADTTTTVASSLNPSVYGQSVTFTATVADVASGSTGTPTGSVQFSIDSVAYSAPVPLSACSPIIPNAVCASFSTSSLTVPSHNITASYGGDANFNATGIGKSTASGVPQTITPAQLTITASSEPMVYGATPPGITASYSGFVNGESVTNLTPGPTCGTAVTSSTLVGTYASSCMGAMDSNYAINYVNGKVTITQATTTTIVISSTGGTSNFLQNVMFTATLAPQFSGTPTGAVTFYDASTGATCSALGTSTQIGMPQPLVVTSGTDSASVAIATLPGAPAPNGETNNILACYSGDSNFFSSSGNTTQIVYAVPFITITPSSNAFTGQSVGTTSSPFSFTIGNIGDAALDFGSPTIVGDGTATSAPSDFSIYTKGSPTPAFCGAILAPGSTCTIQVTFTPQDTGEASALLQLTDNNDQINSTTSQTQIVTLTGGGLSTLMSGGSLYNYAIFATQSSCGSIAMNGNALVDSFNSAIGYGSSHQLSGGNVGTNGNVALTGNSTIYGPAAVDYVTTGNCSTGSPTGIAESGKAKVTGGAIALNGPITFATPTGPNPAQPTANQSINGSCPSGMTGCTNTGTKTVSLAPGTYGNVNVNGGTTVQVTTGTYTFNSLTFTGNSVLWVGSGPGGPAVVNLAGAGLNASSKVMDLSGGSIVNLSGKPSNLEFFYAGSHALNLSGGSQTYATAYAPNAPVNMSGGTDWFGAIIGSTVTNSGGTAVHFDTNLTNIAAGDYLWFTIVVNNVQYKGGTLPSSLGQAKLYLTNSTVSFAATAAQCSGTGGTFNSGTCTRSVPNAVVTLNSASKTMPTTNYDLTNNRWATSVPATDLTGNTFVAGLAVPVPAGGFPTGVQNVSWSAAFSTDTSNITLQWEGNAGVYGTFNPCYAYQNTNSSGACYNAASNSNVLGVNAEDGAADTNGNDPAGTPETFKPNEIIGFFSPAAGVTPAAAEMSVAPSNYPFGTVARTSSATNTTSIVLTNNDGVTHNISGISISGSSDFMLQSGTQSGDTIMVPNCVGLTSLGAGSSCNLHIMFTPTLVGAETAKIVVNDDANNSPQTVYLTGTGQ
jgi:hypothetical protein